MMTEENIEVGMTVAEETIAQIDKTGENIPLTGKTEETTAQGIDKRDKMAEEEIGENTHLKKAEGTLVITDEGDAKGPLVMEGPLQASP